MEQLLDMFEIRSARDTIFVLLDMAIVYAVIYRVLLLIKGTRAVNMAVGIALILGFLILSQESALQLTTTHWVVDMVLSNLIVIVVVIFQHDIRRGLAQFGRASIFTGARSYEESAVLEEIVRAGAMLSSRKLGALIAIEREADLSHYAEEGLKLDGVVSKDLLFSLFLPEHQNPLHDGAVVIQKGRIAAAGCFLPLTVSPRVDMTLGTRHRAAIGLSEDTDAAVIVVSEETGVISVAYDGQLYRDLDGADLRALLQQLYSARPYEGPRSPLIERLREDEEAHEPAAGPAPREEVTP